MKRLVGYCRVSTDNQKDEGTIELQARELQDFCNSNGYELVNIFKDEGVSGGLEVRPALSNLFNFLETNPDVEGVLIFKLDRLARDLYIQELLIKKLEILNKKIISTKELDLGSNDPMRKAFRQFMGIVSELEKSFITMRLSGGRINKARRGLYAGGGVALGYQSKNKDLIVNQENAETIKTIFKLKKNKKSLREIARVLNENNTPTARGGKWYAGTIKYILKNPIYKGIMEYSKVEVKRPELVLISGKRSY